MDKAEGHLFSNTQQSNDRHVFSGKKNERLKGKEVNAISKQGITVNKKLELYLEKYVNSFNEIQDRIEIKGILIDIIRKL